MSSQGPNSGTASDYGSGNPGGSFMGGNVAWTNVTDMDGGSGFATCALTVSQSTHVAEITNLGFSIPSGATINGIIVTFTGKDSSSSHQGQTYLQLLKGGSPTGTAKQPGVGEMATTATGYTLGSSSDTWGGSFAYSDINDPTFGVGVQEQGAGGNNTVSLENFQIEVYYTGGGSPPGAPTGLSLTYVSPTSLQANWTNPSGTLTDNKIQISTDDATWTTIDIGSVVTSYTFTGLTPNTLYYVQVAAVNSSGTGSYSYYAWWPTQATVSLETTLTLVGDLINTGWTIVGSEPTCAATLNSTNDANYLIPPANTGQYLNMALTGVPSNLITVTSAVVNARMKTTSGADTNSITAAVGSLQLQITNALTTSIANYVSANLPLASQQGYAQWNAFSLEAFPFDVNQDNLTYRMSVTITYLAPAPVWPPVGFNNSIMNSCSMASFH